MVNFAKNCDFEEDSLYQRLKSISSLEALNQQMDVKFGKIHEDLHLCEYLDLLRIQLRCSEASDL